jgi:hypothetical protein
MRARRVVLGVAMVALMTALAAPVASAGGGGTFGDPGTPSAPSSAERGSFFAAAAGGSQEARGLTVTPDIDLVDGQVVTVDGTGFGNDGITGIFQCAKGVGIDGCDASTVDIFDANGDLFSREFRVDAILHTEAGDIDCRTFVNGCRLVANDNYSLASAGKADLGFDPDAPLEPPPTVAVDPAADLVDGQVVQVTGASFRPDDFVTLAECPEGATELFESCGNFWYSQADENGEIDLAYQVEADLDGGYFIEGKPEGFVPPDPVDCRTEPCELVAVADEDYDRVGRAALSFDPDAPLRPDMTISVNPNRGLVDGQVVDVHAEGYTPDGPVDVIQCSLSSDLSGSRCDLDRGLHLTADDAGSIDTTYAVHEAFDAPAGRVDCHRESCILAAVDRSVPLDYGRGYRFEYVEFLGDDIVVPDSTVVAPQFTG